MADFGAFRDSRPLAAILAGLLGVFALAALAAPNGPEVNATEARVEPEAWRAVAGGDSTFLVRVRSRRPPVDTPLVPTASGQGGLTIAERVAAITTLMAAGEARLARLDGAIAALEASGHLSEPERFPAAGVVAVTGDARALATLAAHPDVASIHAERRHVLPAGTAAAGDWVPEWNLEAVGAPRAWRELGATGQGVVVATIDSGADWTHPLLLPRYRGRDGVHDYNWWDATRPESPRSVPSDRNGHGTMVLGLIAGRDGTRAYGVAPGAEWIAVRAFDARGYATDRGLLRAAEWLLAPTTVTGTDPRPDLAPDIVNCSWVLENGADPLLAGVVDAWRAAGILPVFAAGNSDDGTSSWAGVLSPASYPETLAIGALTPQGTVWALSKGGPGFYGGVKPDLVAPGTSVRSARTGGGTAGAEGTSMAAPHVAGAAALVLSARPTLNVDDVARFLRRAARDEGEPGPDERYGWGVLDAARAAEWALVSGRLTGRISDAAGQSVEAAIIRVSNGAEGDLGDTRTDLQGRYDLAVPEGRWQIAVSAFGYVTKTLDVVVVPGEAGAYDATLEALISARVTGRVASRFGTPIAGARVGATGAPAGAIALTDGQGIYDLTLPADTRRLEVSAPGHRTARLPVDAVPGETTRLDVDLAAAPRLLLVDADAAYGERAHPYLLRALRDGGYDADVWVIDDVTTLAPGLADLARYDVVIWSHIYRSPGSLDAWRGDQAVTGALASYVSAGGRLLLTGQDVGSNDARGPVGAAGKAESFYRDFLAAVLIDTQATATSLTGLGPLEGLTLDLRWPLGQQKGARYGPDVVAPADGAEPGRVTPVLRFPDGRAAGLAVSDRIGRRMYLAFGPESAGDGQALAALFDRAIGWLESPALTIRAAPGEMVPGAQTHVQVELRAGRSAADVAAALQLPSPLTGSASGVDGLSPARRGEWSWRGRLEPRQVRVLELDARLTGPSPGGSRLPVTATLTSFARPEVVTTTVQAVVPDLSTSTVGVRPRRISWAGPVTYTVSLTNTGLAASAAETMLTLPAAMRPISGSLQASAGAVRWLPEGRVAEWRGKISPEKPVTVTVAGALPSGVSRRHVMTTTVTDGYGVRITRTGAVLVGGPDLSGSRIADVPATVLAGASFTLTVTLENTGPVDAASSVVVGLPPGVEPGPGLDGVEHEPTQRLRQPVFVPARSVTTLPLRLVAGRDAVSGPRDIAVTITDGVTPTTLTVLSASTVLRRAALEASRALLLPVDVRSGDRVTATVLVANHGDAAVSVDVVDSLPPSLVADPETIRVSSGQVTVSPGTIRWQTRAHAAAEDYAWSTAPGGAVQGGGAPVQGPRDPVSGARGPLALGFGFPFYTEVFTRVWVLDDGLITFAPPVGGGEPWPATGATDLPAIAPLWRAAASEAVRPWVKRGDGFTTVTWPATRSSGAFEAVLERSGAITFNYGGAVAPEGAVVGLLGPEGHTVLVPAADVPRGRALAFDPPGGWEWLTVSGNVGHAAGPNSPITHTVRLAASDHERVLTAGILANRVTLRGSTLEVVPDGPAPGGLLDYRLVLAPEGGVEVRGIDVSIDSPHVGRIEAGSLVGGIEVDVPTGALRWRGRLDAGQRHVLAWTVRLPDEVRVGAHVTARAAIAAPGVPRVVLQRSTRVRATDLSGSGMQASRSVARPGDVVVFTLRAANAGSAAATVTLTDALPPGLAYIDGSAAASAGAPPSWQPQARALRWSGRLAPHGAVELGFSARYDGPATATNVMWLEDGHGTHFTDWVEVRRETTRVYLPAVGGDPP